MFFYILSCPFLAKINLHVNVSACLFILIKLEHFEKCWKIVLDI